MARKQPDPFADIDTDELDEKAIAFARQLAKKVGRAISLSVVAATAGPRVEDHAIEAADNAWDDVAVDIIKFALEDDDA